MSNASYVYRALQVAPGRMQLPHEEARAPKPIPIAETERIVLLVRSGTLGSSVLERTSSMLDKNKRSKQTSQ